MGRPSTVEGESDEVPHGVRRVSVEGWSESERVGRELWSREPEDMEGSIRVVKMGTDENRLQGTSSVFPKIFVFNPVM